MTTRIDTSDLKALPIAERLRVIEELWDSIPEADQPALNDWQRQEVDRRLDALESGTSQGSNWTEVRRRLTESG